MKSTPALPGIKLFNLSRALGLAGRTPHPAGKGAVVQMTRTLALECATALKPWARLEEIQGAALYLASDAASCLTGAVLSVDGGETAP